MKKIINWPFFLIGYSIFLISQINCSKSDSTVDPVIVYTKKTNSDLPNVSLDSIVWFGGDEEGKRIFHHDIEQKIDTLDISFKYSPEEKQFSFTRAYLTSDHLVDSLKNKFSDNKGKNPVFIFLNDTLGSIPTKQTWKNNQQFWRLTPNQSKWELMGQGSRDKSRKLIYSYKNELVTLIKTYNFTPSDSTLIWWEKFSYDSNNYLKSHLTQNYTKDRNIKTTSKVFKEHDSAGRLLKEKYLEYDLEEKDTFRIEGDNSYRYNEKGLLIYSTTIDRMTSQDKNTTYEYDDRGNCIAHHTNRFDGGHPFEKKEFEYDEMDRLIRYSLFNRSSENENFRLVTNRFFKYYKTTSRIIEEGNSKADLASKASLEFDEYGNILRRNRSWNKSYIVYKYDYDTPIESVYSDIHDFYNNFKKSELAVYGLKMTTEKRKISHAISSETTYELKGNKYIVTNQKKYYYSNK